MSRHVIVKPLAIAAVMGASAFAVPTASALQDLASPDAQDARPVTHNPIESTDLRSADAQDAAEVIIATVNRLREFEGAGAFAA